MFAGLETSYIHGFSREEQHRLISQAEVLAPNVFAGLNLPATGRLLELGCGVGAELKFIARRRERLELTGIDLSEAHLWAAGRHLAPEVASGVATLVRGDASRLPFVSACFDQVITVWMLEHVLDAMQVMREALRVLKPKGLLVCTEVDNASFGFSPAQPAIAEWWDCFNRYQARNGGDPYVGRRLAEFARRLGCRDLNSERIAIIASRREPERRLILLEYLRDLLLSGARNLLQAGYADAGLLRRMQDEFNAAREDLGVHFHYSAVRLRCRPADWGHLPDGPPDQRSRK